MSKSPSGSGRESRKTNNESARDQSNPDMTLDDLNNLWKQQKQQLNDDQLRSLNYYQDHGFLNINGNLRNDISDERIDKIVDDINVSAIQLPKNFTLNRGISSLSLMGRKGFTDSIFDAYNQGNLVGLRFRDKGFTSTSAGVNQAYMALGYEAEGARLGKKAIQFKIRAKKGSKVIIPSRDHKNSNENEVLLPSGSTFRVIGARLGDNPQTLIVDLDLE